jgi:hypothetical protein
MEAMENCHGKSTRVVIVAFDIQKAFDTVSYQRLADHLCESFHLSFNARQ